MAGQERVGGFAVAAIREDGRWRCVPLDNAVLTNLDAAITALREIRSPGAVIGLLNVDDEFFVIVRPVPTGVDLLLSDSSAALDYDIAADVLDLLRVDTPDEDEDTEEAWPEGDLAILEDLGMPATELQVIIGDVDLWPDEQLRMIAQRCGFDSPFDELLAGRGLS
ncbi:MAG TPA: tRNA adenosine deaminase-associated protein [Pseudonocardiaceae bacterium]